MNTTSRRKPHDDGLLLSTRALGLDQPGWISLANALLINTYVHLAKTDAGEQVWVSEDEKRRDEDAAKRLRSQLVQRGLIGRLASSALRAMATKDWSGWLARLAAWDEEAKSLKINAIPVNDEYDGYLADLIQAAPEEYLDRPIAELQPSAIVRHLYDLAGFYVSSLRADGVPFQFSEEGPAVWPDEHSPTGPKKTSTGAAGPRPPGDQNQESRVAKEIQAFYGENRDKRLRKQVAHAALQHSSLNYSAKAVDRIWAMAQVPDWKKVGAPKKNTAFVETEDLVQYFSGKGLASKRRSGERRSD